MVYKNMTVLADHIILDRLRSPLAGDRSNVIAELYRSHFPSIRKLVCSNSGNEQDAKDLFQDTLYQLIKRLERPLELTCKLQVFIYAIAKRLWMKELRNRGKKLRINTFPEITEASVLEQMLHEERKEKVRTALQELDINCQKVVMYFVYYEWDMETIADVMQYANAQVARNKKCQCMKKLRTVFHRLKS